MGLIVPQTVRVRTNGRTCKHYREKGYEFEKCGDFIEVNVLDLPEGSCKMVKIICDVCGKKSEMWYCTVVKCNKENELITCGSNSCKHKKYEDTCIKKYGVKNPSQLQEVQNKMKATNLERYGCESAIQNEKIKNKIKETNLERYGHECALQSEEVKKKTKETMIKRYGVDHPSRSQEIKNKKIETYREHFGVDNPFQSTEVRNKFAKTLKEKYGEDIVNISQVKEIQDKIKATNLERYGHECVLQSEEIKKKTKETMMERYGVDNAMKSEEIRTRFYEKLQGMNELETIVSPNGKISYFYKKMPCSENQKHLWDLYGGELNCFIENKYSVDILLNDKIYFEYDGTGHNLSVNFGHITEKEMRLKEIRRYQFLKQRGYLQIVFKSLTKRNLPSDEIMLSILKYAQNYFSLNPNQHWIEFDYDNLQIRTKENTFPYDFVNPIL